MPCPNCLPSSPRQHPHQAFPLYAAPYTPGAPGAPGVPAKPPRSPRLGQVAMFLAIAVIVLTCAASVAIGANATVYHYGSVKQLHMGVSEEGSPGATLAQGALGTVFGIWALVQGIVAVAQNRGRKFGIWAIVLAVVAPILMGIVSLAVASAFGHQVSQ